MVAVFLQVVVWRTRKNQIGTSVWYVLVCISTVVAVPCRSHTQLVCVHLVRIHLLLREVNAYIMPFQHFSNNPANRTACKWVIHDSALWREPVVYDLAQNRVKNARSGKAHAVLLRKLQHSVSKQSIVAPNFAL